MAVREVWSAVLEMADEGHSVAGVAGLHRALFQPPA